MEGSTAKSECTLNKQGNRYLSTYYFVDTQHPKYLILLGLMVDVVCQERKRRTIHFSDAICCFVAAMPGRKAIRLRLQITVRR